jgi:hypothetical protein
VVVVVERRGERGMKEGRKRKEGCVCVIRTAAEKRSNSSAAGRRTSTLKMRDRIALSGIDTPPGSDRHSVREPYPRRLYPPSVRS